MGLALNIELYTSKKPELGKAAGAVKNLIIPIAGTGQKLIIGNRYTSFPLVEDFAIF